MLSTLQRRILAWSARMSACLHAEEGQSFVEYTLVLTLVAVGVALLTQWDAFSGALHNSLQRVVNEIDNAGT